MLLFLDKWDKRFAIGVLDSLGANLIGVPVLYADNGDLADRTPACQLRTLFVAHVFALAAKVGFINLHGAVEIVLMRVYPRFADALKHEPCGGLGDPDVPVQFHAADALEVGDDHVDCDCPLAEGYLRALQGRAGLDAEIAAAIAAPVGHLPVTCLASALAAAVTACAAIRPKCGFEPLTGIVFRLKHVHQLDDGHALPTCLSGSLVSHV